MGHLNPNLILSVWGSVSPGVKRKVTTLPSSPRLFLDCCKITDVNIQFPLPDTSSGIVIIWIRPYINTKLLTSQWFLDPGKLQSLETLACFHVVTWVTVVTGSKGMRGWVAPWFSSFFLLRLHWFYHHQYSVQFSCSVMSDSLQPHESQYARPPCPSPTPRVHPNPCPLRRWCHSTISSSVILFSSCPQSFPASGSFQMSHLFTSGGQSIGVSASTSVLAMNTQD